MTGGQFQILGLIKNNSGLGSSALYLDGTQKGTAGTGVLPLTTRYFMGSWNSCDMNGDIAEVALYGTALSTEDRQLAEGLLVWKYGLQGSLPSGHPWENADPAAVPAIANANPSFLSLTNAVLVGSLTSTGASPVTVSVYWGTQDGNAPTSGLWQFTNTFAKGQWAEGSSPSTNVALPTPGVAYYYRFYATNDGGVGFAAESQLFYATNVVVWIQSAAGTHYWTNSANWSPAMVPNSAGLSVVITNDYAVNQTINVDQSMTLGELAYGNTNVTTLAKLTGGAFRFDNGAKPGRIWNLGANGSIAVDVTFGSSTQLEVQVDSTGLTLSGALGGFSNLVKSGSGALAVTAANMFTGDLVIKEGQVGSGSSSSVIPDTSVVQVENGAVFRMGRTDRIRGARGTGYVTHINGVGNGYLVMGTNTVTASGYTYLVDGGFMSPGIGTNIGTLYTGSSSGGDPAAILGGDIYIDVASASSYDRIVFVRASPPQSLILGGNLHLNFAASYLPQTGAYWDIINIQTSGTIADTNGGALFTSIDSSISGATLTAEILTSNKVRVTLQSLRTGTLMIVR